MIIKSANLAANYSRTDLMCKHLDEYIGPSAILK